MGCRAMLKQVNALPMAERKRPGDNRNCQAHRQHRRLDVGGHVIGAFVRVPQIRHAGVVGRRDKPIKKSTQIRLNVGIRIFLDQQ